MNSMWLQIILRLIGLIATSDLFAVQRAAVARQIPPQLLEVIRFLVEVLDPLAIPGKEKAAMVHDKLAQPLYGVVEEAKSVAPNLVNLAIELAVAERRDLSLEASG